MIKTATRPGANGESAVNNALSMCAPGIGRSDDECHVVARTRHSKTFTYLLALRGETVPRYVVKVHARDGVGWDVRREYEGLTFIRDRFAGLPGLDTIEPIGYGEDPKFLVTRYQPGENLHRVFCRALRPWANGRFDDALEHARRLGEWLRVFRGDGQPGGGLTPEQYARQCSERLDELEQLGMPPALVGHVRLRIDGYLAELSPEAVEMLSRSYPTHGDMALQNFIVSPDGRAYAMDLEGFGYEPGHVDFCHLYVRLAEWRYFSLVSRGGLSGVWAAFADSALSSGPDKELALLGIIHYVVNRLEWTERTWRRNPSAPWLRSTKFCVVANRLSLQLRRLPADIGEAAQSCRCLL